MAALDSSRKYRQALREKVNRTKEVPCLDCGVRYPHYVMEFDHVPERGIKLANISDLISSKRVTLLEQELEKCDIVCANCHKVRTHFRRQVIVQ